MPTTQRARQTCSGDAPARPGRYDTLRMAGHGGPVGKKPPEFGPILREQFVDAMPMGEPEPKVEIKIKLACALS
jgi:hypothetical protein